MALEYFTKQPYETFMVAADFSADLDTGETITEGTSDVIAEDKNGDDATSDVLTIGAKVVDEGLLKIRVKDGTENLTPYKITFRAVTSLVNKYELDISMRIKEL